MDPVPIGSTSFGRHWLDRPAADSWFRMVAAGCPPEGITDAGRTLQEQIAVFTSRYRVQWIGTGPFNDVRWWNGLRYVRFQGAAVAVPGSVTARHTFGRALDLHGATKTWVRANGARYGWLKDQVRNEDWHMEYVPSSDVVLVNSPGGSVGTVPTVPTLPDLDPLTPKEADDMAAWFPGFIVTYPGTTAKFLLSPDLATKRHLHGDEVAVLVATGAVQNTSITQATIDAAAWTPCHDIFKQV